MENVLRTHVNVEKFPFRGTVFKSHNVKSLNEKQNSITSVQPLTEDDTIPLLQHRKSILKLYSPL